MEPLILAIESSCDDSSVAVARGRQILTNKVSSQIEHAKYGGVVPEVASRRHLMNLPMVLQAALAEAGTALNEIDAIAFTQGPGLLGSLLVGANFVKGLSLALQKPLIAVNHIEAHVLALWIEHQPELPCLVLTVSGGHTQITLVQEPLQHTLLGQTLDDAAGEAFDKIAKMLGLPYPGGPLIDKLAQQGEPIHSFPKSQIPDFNFSFSGLKTAVLYYLQKLTPEYIQEQLPNLAASVQHTIVDTLLEKMEMAIKKHKPKSIGLVGGVAANSLLRKKFTEVGLKYNLPAYIPAFAYCTDNAAMIAITAYFLFQKQQFASLRTVPFAKQR